MKSSTGLKSSNNSDISNSRWMIDTMEYTNEAPTELNSLINMLKSKIQSKDPHIQNIKYPKLLVESLEELDRLVGMDTLKDSISMQVMRLIDNLSSKDCSSKMLNTILYGPPGVGKTKVGIIMAKIWFSLGYLEKSKESEGKTFTISGEEDYSSLIPIAIIILFYGATYIFSGLSYAYNKIGLLWLTVIMISSVILLLVIYNNKTTYNWIMKLKDYGTDEDVNKMDDRDIIKVVSRQDFVAEYLGQTATKTKKLLHANVGKVLFIDEAYSLLNDPRDAYGMEALTTLNLFMSENPNSIAVIFAGYKDLMKHGIFTAQPGLPRRCMWHFECSEYAGEELFEIFMRQVSNDGWAIKPGDSFVIKRMICDNEDYFPAYGGDTERLLFYSQLEASKSKFHDHSNNNVLTINHIRSGLEKLKENNINN